MGLCDLLARGLVDIPAGVDDEYPVSPRAFTNLSSRAHDVLIQRGAGLGSAIADKDYLAAGAKLLDTRRSSTPSNVRHSANRWAHFQHNKFKLAELVTTIDVTRAFLDLCLSAHATAELSPVDAAKLQWWAAQVQNNVLDECLQLHAGYGFMNEYRIARAGRDARVTKIWAGTNEIMKELIGRDLGF